MFAPHPTSRRNSGLTRKAHTRPPSCGPTPWRCWARAQTIPRSIVFSLEVAQAEEQAMARIIQTASAQMGPIAKSETRKDTVKRLIALMREAKGRGAELVVFTELALTTFFPRWLIEDQAELDSYYERAMP